MTKYLLLRDNKETGPYAFNELREKGLKAYDLVWIEGRSAAWRYPSEVEELKPFAPIVEEQPFDRFFKKTSTGQATAATVQTAPATAGGSVAVNLTADTDNEVKTPSEKKIVPLVTAPSVVFIASASAATTSSVAVTDSSRYMGEPSTVPGKRIIYVTYPTGKPAPAPVVAKETTPRETAAEVSAYATPGNAPIRTTADEPAYARSSVPSVSSAPSFTEASLQQVTMIKASARPAVQPVGELNEENYTQSGNDWKRSVEISPRPARQRLSRFLQPLAVALCIIALLAAGIFIGLSINKDTFPLRQKLAVTETPVRQIRQVGPPVTPVIQPPPAAVLTSTPPAGNDPVPQSQQDISKGKPGNTRAVTVHVSAASAPVSASIVKKKNMVADKSGISKNQALAVAGRDSGAENIPVVHREASHRADPAVEKVDKDLIRSNLSSLVSVGAGNYTVGTFGGISDLQVTVSNRSVYPLDLVVVEVQYLQSNKKVFKTENLYFRRIGAGSALMQEAPKSPRGIKVQYKITAVNSKEWGLSYSAL